MPSHLTPHQRFWAKVNKDGPVPDYAPHLGPCWLWTACRVDGYGQFGVGGGHRVYAHRWVYEQACGAIPDGLECDHLCRVRHCVRSSHIQLVSNQVNVLRGEGLAAQNAQKTHCPQGHSYDEANTYHRPSGSEQWRECAECRRERGVCWRQKNPEYSKQWHMQAKAKGSHE